MYGYSHIIFGIFIHKDYHWTNMNNNLDFDDAFWREVFSKADKNKDGLISKKEFKNYMKKHGCSSFSIKDVQKVFSYCDSDGSGYIDLTNSKLYACWKLVLNYVVV
ncbi:unnamed protein product [Heterobilharzia americana]|nr:unnamed protein product [Heterobilharzia americana]